MEIMLTEGEHKFSYVSVLHFNQKAFMSHATQIIVFSKELMTMLFSLSAIPRDRLSLTLGITLIRGNLSLIKAQLTIIRGMSMIRKRFSNRVIFACLISLLDDMVQLYQWQSSVSSGM